MEKQIDFLQLYQEIFRILPAGNIQELMDACYDIVGVPILTVDIMYNLFGIAPQEKTGDYYWDYLLENHGYDADIAVLMYEQGIMQSVNSQKAPYVINWGNVNKDFPKIQGVIKVNDIVEGYVTMQCREDEITPDKMKAMEIIQNALALFFKEYDTENSMYDTYHKVFIGELIDNRIHDEKQLELWLKNLGFSMEAPYRFFAISMGEVQEKNVLSYLRRTILPFFPYQLSLTRNNILYILEYHLNVQKDASASESQFNQILAKFNAHCGISNAFFNLLESADYQMQAEDALSLGKRFYGQYHIHHYQDYYLPAILAPRAAQMPQVNYLSPVILKLRQYDETYAAELLPTLQSFIAHMLNTSETAKELHIHRNTLLYRINKMEEIADFSLKDHDTVMHLMISFYMMGFSDSHTL